MKMYDTEIILANQITCAELENSFNNN
jgi:hypothetical protein